jgi:hypothetical protein
MEEYGALRNVTKRAIQKSRIVCSECGNILFKFVLYNFEYAPFRWRCSITSDEETSGKLFIAVQITKLN